MVSAYAVLDDPDQWAAFSVPDPDSQDADKTQGVWHSQVVVEGMHCGSCALNVEKALCAVPGVTQVTVNGAMPARKPCTANCFCGLNARWKVTGVHACA